MPDLVIKYYYECCPSCTNYRDTAIKTSEEIKHAYPDYNRIMQMDLTTDEFSVERYSNYSTNSGKEVIFSKNSAGRLPNDGEILSLLS